MDPFVADQVAGVLAAQKTGTVTLARTTQGTPNPSTPWVPGAATTAVYTLDAVVRGTSVQRGGGETFGQDATIVTSELMVIVSPRATLNGATVELVPQMTDTLTIDGKVRAIKRILPAPAGGSPALFRIFVAS